MKSLSLLPSHVTAAIAILLGACAPASSPPAPRTDAAVEDAPAPAPRIDAAPGDGGARLPGDDAAPETDDVDASRAAARDDAGPEAPCVTECRARARECGAPEGIAIDRCRAFCAAEPTGEQLECVRALSCAALTCTEPALPCAVGVTETVPLASCPEVCRDTAERCGAPAEIAAARCDELCPEVEHGEQLACLRDAACAALECIEAAGHAPCGIDLGRPR